MDIAYLEQVREDLVEAAEREARRRRRPGRAPRPGRSVRALVAAGTATVLVAAGGLGWFVTRGGMLAGGGESTAPSGLALEGATNRLVDWLVEGPALPAMAPADEGFRVDLAEQATRGESLIPVGDLTKVIRTATLSLVVPPDTFEERFAEAQDVAERLGGYVQTSTGRDRSGTLVMRVPASRFAAAMRELRGLGEVEVQSVRGQDVTADYVDLQARLRIAKARRAVLLGLMAQATTIEQTIRVQNALDDTQLRIEELQGALSLLEDRVSFATIRLSLREEGVTEVRNPSIPLAFERAIAAFFGVIAGTIVGLGYLVPILVLAAVAWSVIRRIRRRRPA
jgi:hypothetical protein